ncbi:endonuclease VII domain-containing protein [Streptomyces sp.]|uniref:endonuclease VII domain-containing protein n=1 Tax=Streptomyces sp. TaxID=1931 RepID=UPI002F92FA01
MADSPMPARPNAKPLCIDCNTEPKIKGHSVCRACNYQRVKAWRVANPEKFAAQVARENAKVTPEVRRRRLLSKKYGITPRHYDEMLKAQSGVCAGCGLPEKDNVHGVLAVDHDHETRVVRGLLCNPCNTVLGLVKEDAETLLVLVDYLRSAGRQHDQAGTSAVSRS